jgi:hypothetical protein
MHFDRFYCRKATCHPQYSYVDIFYKAPAFPAKTIMTYPYKSDATAAPKNVIIASTNSLITKYIFEHEKSCITERQWILVPRAISEAMRMDLVVLKNTFCDLATKDQCWEINYYIPSDMPAYIFRSSLQLSEHRDEDEDLSHLP